MIRTLDISGYRCLPRFRMESLARVNLLVGTNNSGKTSVLEAVSILASAGDPSVLFDALVRRGERLTEETEQNRLARRFDVSHLFTGHALTFGTEFSVESRNEGTAERVACRVAQNAPDTFREPALFAPDDQTLFGTASLVIECAHRASPLVLPLTHRGGLRQETVNLFRNSTRSPVPDFPAVRLITTQSALGSTLGLWEGIALTSYEERVLDALRIIEPSIERIAVVGRGRGGVLLRLRGVDQPVPIGSLGDGISRLLAIAIALIRSANGVFLIDEIDTGLHYTVMEDMWRMIAGLAAQLNVQVFATTHSSDCVNSLATISQRDSDSNTETSLQRLERQNDHAIAFTEREIAVAADRGVEVR